MASEVDQALQPQPRAQRLQPPAITVNPRNCVDGEPSAAEPSIRSPRKPNGATQQEPERPTLFSDDEDNDSSSSRASEPVSEQMTSPSVSSPPYWTHNKPASSRPPESNLRPHTPGHARAVSNASADSVLPPGAITLQDNEADEDENGDAGDGYRRSNSSEVYGRDRNRACWARSVQVTDYVLVNGGTTNLGAFVVWIIRVETFNVSYGPSVFEINEEEGKRKLTGSLFLLIFLIGLLREHSQALLRVRRPPTATRPDIPQL
jgi:hypothetical protein